MREILDYVRDVASPSPGTGPLSLTPEPPAGGERQVHFRKERPVRLGASSEYERRVLQTLKTIEFPAYVEVSDDDLVTAVRVPVVGAVTGLAQREDGRFDVTLDRCAAVFDVGATPDREDMLQRLRQSMTEGTPIALVDDARRQQIIRVLPAPDDDVTTEGDPPAALLGMPQDVALEVLDAAVSDILAAEACQLPPQGDCMPFLYVLDGCWARSHRLCERLIARHIPVSKVWVFPPQGQLLRARTDLSPRCVADWKFHTAPLVEITGLGRHVVDPSLSPDGAVPLAQWLDIMEPGGVQLRFTDASIYRIGSIGNGRRENLPPEHQPLSESERDLRLWAERLLELSRDTEGPQGPPYEMCDN